MEDVVSENFLGAGIVERLFKKNRIYKVKVYIDVFSLLPPLLS